MAPHPFEKQFGPGPYRFEGYWAMPSQGLLAANPQAYNNAIADAPRTGPEGERIIRVGSCHHCGTGILHHYILSTPAGLTFIVGSDCIFKAAPKSAVASEVREHRRQREREVRSARKAAQRKEREAGWRREGVARARIFLAERPELRDALTVGHSIHRDMASRLVRWGNLSEKAEAFAIRLAAEERRKANGPVLVEIDVPAGRHTVEARIMSFKSVPAFSGYGYDTKMLVEVTHEGQTFRAFGTAPASMKADRDDTITLTATFEPREKGFGFFKRPRVVAKKLEDANCG